MPTVYTEVVGRGATFEQFAWVCARAFMALGGMRGRPLSEPVPETFEPSPHYAKKLAESKAELARICNMGLGNAAMEAIRDYEETASRNQERLIENAVLKHSYAMMLDRVQDWIPPSCDSVAIKDFMVNQLRESMRFDCGEAYREKLPPTDPNKWLEKKRSKLEEDVAYYQKLFDEEVDRVSKCNEWVRVLRESVPQPDLTNLWAKDE